MKAILLDLTSFLPGEPEKFQLLKTYSIKSTSLIWMIQILVKSQKIEVFLWFFSLSQEH